jgi:MYXO-CTERM domain-containing protein
MFTRKLIVSAVAVAACGFAATASAGFTNEDFASWHGSANSTYYSWDNFTSAGGAPNWSDQGGSDALVVNVGDPNDAMLTGGGNMYGFGGGLDIHTYVYADDVQEVQFNISASGTAFDWAGVALVYTTTDGGQGYLPNFGWNENYSAEDGFGGFSVNMSFSWDLSMIAGTIDSIGVFASSSEAHTSLDAISIDVLTGAIPAPGALALLGIAGIAGRRRRRN